MIPIIGISVWFIVKIFVIFAIGLYIIFALVVVRQVGLMTETVDSGFELPIKVFSYLHLGLAILALLIALFVL